MPLGFLVDYFIFQREFFMLTAARAMLHWTRREAKNRETLILIIAITAHRITEYINKDFEHDYFRGLLPE